LARLNEEKGWIMAFSETAVCRAKSTFEAKAVGLVAIQEVFGT
jgi:hypothetical protein